MEAGSDIASARSGDKAKSSKLSQHSKWWPRRYPCKEGANTAKRVPQSVERMADQKRGDRQDVREECQSESEGAEPPSLEARPYIIDCSRFWSVPRMQFSFLFDLA